jgi:hypothetical protein
LELGGLDDFTVGVADCFGGFAGEEVHTTGGFRIAVEVLTWGRRGVVSLSPQDRAAFPRYGEDEEREQEEGEKRD